MSSKNKQIGLVLASLIFFGIVGFQLTDGRLHMLQSPGATVPNYQESDYGLGSSYVDSLKTYPELKDGERQPFNIWEYAGRGKSSFGSPELPIPFDEWLSFHKKQKPELMKDVRKYMDSRYDFNGKTIPEKFMSGERKPIMAGPIAKLSKKVASLKNWQS